MDFELIKFLDNDRKKSYKHFTSRKNLKMIYKWFSVLYFASPENLTCATLQSVRDSGSHISDFVFFVFERTKHQPRRNLRSYLVLQRLCNEAALSPGINAFLY